MAPRRLRPTLSSCRTTCRRSALRLSGTKARAVSNCECSTRPSFKDNHIRTRGLAIVCPGRTEMIEKYFEVARDLQARGFAIAIFDWPGQGLSGRLLKDPFAGHIRSFSDYAEALVRGLDKIRSRAPKTWVVVAHSDGRRNRSGDHAPEQAAGCRRRVLCADVGHSGMVLSAMVRAGALRLFGFGGLPQPFRRNRWRHSRITS